jgi:two-component system NtrC family sensor kinase
MLRLHDLSFRYKIPLRGSVLVLITAFMVTASLIVREYDELRQDLATTSGHLGRVLANTLVAPLVHDDPWRAYEIINSPFHGGPPEVSPQTAALVMVLDANQRVFVATDPNQYPMLSDPARANADFYELWQAVAKHSEPDTRAVEAKGSETIYMVTPVISDGYRLGTLIMGYSKSAFLPRFFGIAKRAGLITVMVLVLLLPASWYWGQRFARPLVDLSQSMGKIGAEIPAEGDIRVYESKDEIGQLGAAFKSMLQGLRDKQALEREVMLSERLAAVGRLASGVAHEINNPLGGMLNAISTYRRHGSDDPLAARTLELIERGLLQVKDTVSALLVEARVQSHPLTRQDIEDTRTLVQADALHKHVRFDWRNEVDETLALPSTLVRQILINLMLNAVQAAPAQGSVSCRVARDEAALRLQVRNDGDTIPQERMEHLFEPFSSQREDGHGLGLWVTYQIVRQLGGEIVAESVPEETRFTVTLPLAEAA